MKEMLFKLNPREKMKRQSKKFNPSSPYLQLLVADFLNNGGKIKKIEVKKEQYEHFMCIPVESGQTDNFLMER